MIKRYYLGLCALALSNTTLAGGMGAVSPVADKNFFVGIGGGYNSAHLEKQTIYGKGVSDAYLGPILASTGSAAGTSNPFHGNEDLFSPHAQAGYFKHFNDGTNFWGAKFVYDYLNAHLTDSGMTIPQAGSNYEDLTKTTIYFTGNYAVESVQTSINHELLLLAFLGHSFKHSNVYLGVGPSLFGMHSNIYNLTGYANYKGQPYTDISGAPVSLSKSMWEWGGAAQLGLAYSLSSSWFLDFNYTYAATARNTIKYVSPFTNQIAGANVIGTSYINPSQQVAVQSFRVSINKAF